MIYLYSLNELTWFRFAVFGLLGRNVYLLPLIPLFPPTRKFLQKFADWAIVRGWAKPISDLFPELTPDWELPLTMMDNMFEKLEPWQRAYYRFDHVEGRLPDYALAYRQILSNYLGHRLYTMLAIRRAVEEKDAVHVFGILPDITEAMVAYAGPGIRQSLSPLWMPKRVLIFFITVLLNVYSIGWILLRIRPFPKPVKKYFFAADYINDPDDINFYKEIEDGGPVLLVVRNKDYNKDGIPENIAHYDRTFIKDGVFSIRQALVSIGFVLKDAIRLFSILGGLEASLFYLLITMPFRRIVYRAFFNRYRPEIFWGRDPYNVEHILRRTELAHIGGKSWCSFHSYPTYTCIFPMYRYISFDRLYTISHAFHEKYYCDTWSPDMEVISASTFRASREFFSRRLPTQDRPNSILILCAIYIREPAMIELIRVLATTFPDREIFFQIKRGFKKTETALDFIEQCTKGLDNIKLTSDSVYELLLRTRYVFSDPSTVVMEAIQFGAYSFAIDMPSIQKANPLRDIPDICVTSGAEAISKIKSIEDNSWDYPIETLENFVDISGESFYDTVRKDLGIAVRELPSSVWNLNNSNQGTAV